MNRYFRCWSRRYISQYTPGISYMMCGINVSSEVVFASLAKHGQLVNVVKPHKTVALPFCCHGNVVV